VKGAARAAADTVKQEATDSAQSTTEDAKTAVQEVKRTAPPS